MRTVILSIIFIFSMYLVSNAQKSSFTNYMNEFARIAELSVEKVDVLNSTAVFSKQFENNKQYLEYTEYEGYVNLKVSFYSMDDLKKILPTERDVAIFALSLLVMNDSYPFGAWSLTMKTKPDSVYYLGLQYGTVRAKLDDRYFGLLANSMMEAASEYEKTLNDDYGFGIARKDINEEIKTKFKEIAEKQKKIFLKNIAK